MQKDIDFNADKVVELESDGFLYEDIIAQHDTQLQRLGRASLEHTEQFGEITFNILAEKGDRRAEIKRVDGVIADEKEARAQSTEVLKAEIGKNSAEIFSMKDVYANDEKSRALQQQLIESKFKFNDSAILEIRETTSTLEASYAEQKLQLESVTQRIDETDKTVKESSARINEAQKTATDAKNAQTEYQKVSESKFDEHQSSIEQSQLTANDALRSIAKISTELSAESARQNENINQANASLKRQDTVIATQTEALTQTKVELTAQLNDNKAYIGRIDTALATETTARTTAETQMKAEIGENKAALTRIEKTVVDNEQSFSQSITQLNSQYESANSSITALSKTVADNKKAQAEENKLIKAELGENAAAIEQRAQTVFDHQGNGSAIYKIQAGINWNGQYHDAKFIIGAEVKNGQVTTQIGFSADTFGILNPSSGKLEPVFFVENGQVFINEAFINQATIERLLIGSTIKSKHWDPVTKKGLMLDFESGKIIASDAEITGKITATSGILNNVVISEDCEIKGTLKANQIEGDVIRVHSIPFDGSITLPAEAFDRTLVIPALTVSTMGSSDFGNITWHVEVKINDRIIISFSPLSSVTGSRSAGGDRYEIYAITAGATSGSGVIYANETPTISYKIVGKVSGYNLIHKIPAQCLVFKS
ncbi:phage tail tip fiber protein [Moellerella wisconsensis]